MKFSWNKVLNFHSYVTFPTAGLFLVYSIGAALLRGQWILLLWAIGAMLLSVILQFTLGVMSE